MEYVHDLPMSSLRFFGLRAKFQSRVFTQFELEPLRVGARSGCRSAPAIASACMMLSAISSGLNGLVILAEASTSRMASRGDRSFLAWAVSARPVPRG